MSTTDEVTLTFHGSSFLELAYKQTTVFIDPVFASSRRGRRLRGSTRPCDYVFVTQPGDNFDDVLDVLEDSEDAVLVGSERTCKMAKAELNLARGRALDLEPWERAHDDAFRVTAVPITAPSIMDDSVSMLEELTGGAGGVLPRGLGRLPRAGVGTAMRGLRALGGMPLLGDELLRGMRGRPALGFLFEITSGQRVLDLSCGVHAGTDEKELEDIAGIAQSDVVLIDIDTQGIESVVRAVRIVGAPTVLLYRSHDPYARGRRAAGHPASAYIEAINEDRGEHVEALHLREGDRFVLSAPEKKPEAPAANKQPSQAPAAAPRVAKPSLWPRAQLPDRPFPAGASRLACPCAERTGSGAWRSRARDRLGAAGRRVGPFFSREGPGASATSSGNHGRRAPVSSCFPALAAASNRPR